MANLRTGKSGQGAFCREFGGVALKQDQESNILGQYPSGVGVISFVQLIRLLRRYGVLYMVDGTFIFNN